MVYLHNWCLEVWGDYACFTRPEMKVERVSYDVMTPSSARAIFESILWKPAIRWNITKIEVLSPIKWISVRRNEVSVKVTFPTAKQLSGALGEPMGVFIDEIGIDGKLKNRQQRAGLFLRDVKYRINGYFDFIPPGKRKDNKSVLPEFWADQTEEETINKLDESEAKYAAMFERRAKKGQCFHRPYLGCREFACDFKLVNPQIEACKTVEETRDLGFMLYDIDFDKDPQDPTPMFFHAHLDKGIVTVPHWTSTEVKR